MKTEKLNIDNASKRRKSRGNKKFYIRFINVSVVFALCTAFFLLSFSSFSWFYSNNSLNIRSSQITSSTENITCTFTLCAYDLNKQEATDNKVVKNDSGQDETIVNSLSGFDFNTHDAIFKELNQYTTVFLQIDITGAKIGDSQPGTLHVHLLRNSGASTSSMLNKVVSNVLFFGLCTSDELIGIDSINGKWEKIKEYLEDESDEITKKTFISQSGSTYSVGSSVDFDYEYSSDDVYEKDGENTVTLFIVMDYDEEFTLKMLSQIEGEISSGFSAERIIPMQNDLKSLTVSLT